MKLRMCAVCVLAVIGAIGEFSRFRARRTPSTRISGGNRNTQISARHAQGRGDSQRWVADAGSSFCAVRRSESCLSCGAAARFARAIVCGGRLECQGACVSMTRARHYGFRVAGTCGAIDTFRCARQSVCRRLRLMGKFTKLRRTGRRAFFSNRKRNTSGPWQSIQAELCLLPLAIKAKYSLSVRMAKGSFSLRATSGTRVRSLWTARATC